MEKILVGDTKMAGNMAGGTHHAFRDEGSGYCIFSDLAICAEKRYVNMSTEFSFLIWMFTKGRSAKIFHEDERVYTVSSMVK